MAPFMAPKAPSVNKLLGQLPCIAGSKSSERNGTCYNLSTARSSVWYLIIFLREVAASYQKRQTWLLLSACPYFRRHECSRSSGLNSMSGKTEASNNCALTISTTHGQATNSIHFTWSTVQLFCFWFESHSMATAQNGQPQR